LEIIVHKILIVDDEENVLHSLKRILSKERNWEVITCDNPMDALDIANATTIHLFISDYRMPVMNGVEFLVFTKQNNPDAVRLILSGATDYNGLRNAINLAEIYRFINKPVDSQELITTVKRALSNHDLAVENNRLAKQVKTLKKKRQQS
jgi:YesN/AraC family two-component response regulator